MKLKYIIKKNLYVALVVAVMFQLNSIKGVLVFAQENTIENTTDQVVIDQVIKVELTTEESSAEPTSIPQESLQEPLDASSTATSTPVGIFIETPIFISTGTSTASMTDSTTTETVATLTSEYHDAQNSTTTITTGESVALANILNIVNTNLVNSTGSIVLANIIDEHQGVIDLRTTSVASSTEVLCTLLVCNGIDSIKVKIEADASIDNLIVVDALSGKNKIENAKNAVISTGNVVAGLNLVNVANTNFIDSTYLLLSLNSFVDVNGDIIFPSLSNFFAAQNKALEIEKLNSTQTAHIFNSLDVSANAGNNQSGQSGSGITRTGDSISSTNIYNNLNSLLVGGNSVSIFLKVTGDWKGKLFGAPAGTSFSHDNNLHVLQFEDNANTLKNLDISQEINSTTTANIYNTVHVLSDSGNNDIENADNSTIQTGTARTSANIINIANSNIVGRNWILAVINIFGDFNGNVLFGTSDLWLGQKVSAESYIDNGTLLTYTLTVINNGDSAASGVYVTSTYDNQHLDIIDSSIPYSENQPGTLRFNISDLGPNQAKEITFHARIKNTIPGTKIINTSTVTGYEPENTTDNTDTTVITTSYPVSIGGTSVPVSTPQVSTVNPATVQFNVNAPIQNIVNSKPPANEKIVVNEKTNVNANINISIIRQTPQLEIIGLGTKGEQILIVRNQSDDVLPSVKFDDILYDENGNQIQTESWDLGDLLPNEEVTLTYDISFGSKAVTGTYSLSSQLTYGAGKNLNFTKNGTIAYTIPGVVITKTQTIPNISSKQKSQKLVGAVLGAFIQSISPETAYAAELGESQISNDSNEKSLFYIPEALFLLLPIWYIYHRQKRSRRTADYTILS